MRLELLGPFRLTTDTGEILITAAKQKALLAYLACTAPRPQPRDQLLELLWGGRFETQARQNLRQAVSKLRQAVGANVIVNDHGALTVNDELLESDYAELQRLTPARSAEAADKIAGLWQGEFLQDLSVLESAFEAWLETERRRVREAVVEAMRDLAAGENERGNAKTALAKARTAVALEPFRDDLRRVVMEAFWRSGRGADALRHFDDYAGLLERELQAKPEAETRALAQRIRSGESALVTPAKEQRRISASPVAGGEAAKNANGREGSQSASAGVNELKKRQSRSAAASARRERRPLIIAAAVAASLIIGATVGWLSPWQATETLAPIERPAFPLQDKPSLAILPFENLGSTADQGYFATGLASDLITDLARFDGLRVISRTTSFNFRDQTAPVSAIATQLSVRYILEGSVRRTAGQLRINVSLVDTEINDVVWAERFDGREEDLFTFQDRIRERITSALEVTLSPDETRALERRKTTNLEAYEAYLRGMREVSERRVLDVESIDDAEAAFKNAIELDPEYALAHAGLAWVMWLRSEAIFHAGGIEDKAFARAEQSQTLQENALAHRTLAKKYFSVLTSFIQSKRDPQAAVRHLEKARDLRPNDPDILADLAATLPFVGRAGEALALFRTAVELNPNFPGWYYAASTLGYLFTGETEQALRDARLWAEAQPKQSPPYLFQAVAHGLLGNAEAARSAYVKFDDLEGIARFSLYYVKYKWPMEPQEQKLFVRGLEAAGVK